MSSGPAYKQIEYRLTKDDWHIVGVPYTCVPGFDFQAACRGMGQQEIETELLRNWNVGHGKLVYSFSRELHVARDPIQIEARSTIFCGWDLPGVPACVLGQLNEYGQLLLPPPILQPASESIGVYEFAERVAERLQRVYALPAGMELDGLNLVHIGDPAGNYPVARTGRKRQEVRSAFDVLRLGSKLYVGESEEDGELYEERPGWGWRVVSGELTNTKRQEALRARLSTILPGGLSALVVCPTAHQLIDAFANYAFKKVEGMDNTYSREPIKNQASHCINALEYMVTRLTARPPRKEPDPDEEEVSAFVSGAAPRSWQRRY